MTIDREDVSVMLHVVSDNILPVLRIKHRARIVPLQSRTITDTRRTADLCHCLQSRVAQRDYSLLRSPIIARHPTRYEGRCQRNGYGPKRNTAHQSKPDGAAVLGIR